MVSMPPFSCHRFEWRCDASAAQVLRNSAQAAVLVLFVASVLPGAPIYLTTTPYVYGQSADSLHVSASDLKSRPGGFLLLCAGCGIYVCESFQYIACSDSELNSRPGPFLLLYAGCGIYLCESFQYFREHPTAAHNTLLSHSVFTRDEVPSS